MAKIKITWEKLYHPSKGWYGHVAETTIEKSLPAHISDIEICEFFYQITNGDSELDRKWIERNAPENRTHTALSVHNGQIVDGKIQEYGDRISIDDRTYEVASIGWKRVA